MAVLSWREIVPRSFSHKFGESPTAEIRIAATLDGPTGTQAILSAIGIFHGASHPEYAYLRCVNGQVSEGTPTPYHAEVTYSYEVPQLGSDTAANPLARADVWSFSTGGAAVPALTYFEGSSNSDRRALINSAGDFFEGAMTEESELRASISGNRASFPLADAVAATNTVNDSGYLGGAAYTWKCAGISGQQATEVVDGTEINYWQVTAELVYRQSGWNLLIPNVGWNYINALTSKKERCFVYSEGERVASANPMALNADGSINFSSDYTGSGAPLILERRVHRTSNFSAYFGVPT
jgi:hypothetical protein